MIFGMEEYVDDVLFTVLWTSKLSTESQLVKFIAVWWRSTLRLIHVTSWQPTFLSDHVRMID